MRISQLCRGVTLVLIVGVTSATTPIAAAAPPPASGPDSPKEKARGLAQQGIKAFQAGQQQQAIDFLSQAEALFHAPVHSLFMARANAALGKLVEAKALFHKVASEELSATAPQPWVAARDAAAKELAELDARIPRIVVTVSPDGAPDLVVTMNDGPLPGNVGAPLELNPGTYVFKATSNGQTASQTVEAKESSKLDVRLVIAAKKVIAPPPPASPATPPLRIVSFAAMGLGGASVIVGAVVGGLGLKDRGDANKAFTACDQKFGHNQCQGTDADAVKKTDKTATLMENVGLGALAGGAAVAGAGIVLFIVSKKGPAPQTTGGFQVIPVVAPGYVGLNGRF